MERYGLRRGPGDQQWLEVPHRGARLLRHPAYNKGTAFTADEREALGLRGLLPSAVNEIEKQAQRAFRNIMRKTDDLERYVGLAALQDRNETLFHRVLLDHVDELLPIVHAPTVACACRHFSRIFRRGRGLWITPEDRGHVSETLANAPFDEVRLIVATDNERVLGLGDLGAGGMALSIGKLALYTAFGGIPPWQTLPVSLDVGTDNPELLADDLYLGWRFPRLRGADYDALVEEFVIGVKRRFPWAVLQWEDLRRPMGLRLLERYRGVIPSFDDDIQGSAAAALAAILASERVSGRRLADERVVIAGAGVMAVGIARMLRRSLGSGAHPSRLAVVDTRGLLVGGIEIRDDHKRELAWPRELADRLGLSEGPRHLEHVVRSLKPTVLIGASGEAGLFDQRLLEALTERVERPLVMPLSSPAAQSEGLPADIARWTGGRALVATGCVLAPDDPGRAGHVSQASSLWISPGVVLGCLVAQAREVRDEFFVAAAQTLAALASSAELAEGALFPPATALRRVASRVARAVVTAARETGAGRVIAEGEIDAAIAKAMWSPGYLPMRPAPDPLQAATQAARNVLSPIE